MTAIVATAVQGGSVRPDVLLYPLGVWVVMAVLAVVNGVVRESLIIPRTGEAAGHYVSTALLILAILAVSALYFSRSSIAFTWTELLVIGVVWVVLTVGFEFVVGYFEGTPVSVTIGQYNLLAGEVWIFVPITLLIAPLVFGWYLAPS